MAFRLDPDVWLRAAGKTGHRPAVAAASLVVAAVLAGTATVPGQTRSPTRPGANVPRPGGSTAPASAEGPDGGTESVPTTQPGPAQPAEAAKRAALAPPRSRRPAPIALTPTYPDVSTARRASTRPAGDPRPLPVDVVSDAEVEQAIRRGADALIDQFDEKTGRLRAGGDAGTTALCAYALVAAGVAVDDPRLRTTHPFINAVLDATRAATVNPNSATYSIGLRAAALSAGGRPADLDAIRADVRTLAFGHTEGAYGYAPAGMRGRRPMFPATWRDNSNSQYGLLGVWAGAEAGADTPGGYWKVVYDYWAGSQFPNGKWDYLAQPPRDVAGSIRSPIVGNLGGRGPSGSLSMTLAGAASVLVASEYAEADGGFRVGRAPYPPPLRSALGWLEKDDNAVDLRAAWWGYTVYGVERVGLQSGLKYLGKHDWFRVLARQAIDRQLGDGSWGDLLETSYALLFLSRGRLPILMNKLRLDDAPGRDVGDAWNNRPHDVDFLARFTAKQVEKGLNWQVISLGREPEDWLDAPILFLGSHQRLSFKEPELAKLRRYVEAGGMIVTNADSDAFNGAGGLAALAAGGPQSANAFDAYVADLAAKLFPQYEYRDVPTAHPLLTALYRLENPRPVLKGVSNGSRLLLVHSPKDVAVAWQRRDAKDPKLGQPAHRLGVNLFVYAAGRRQELYRHRLESAFVPARPGPAAAAVAVARLRYAGNWDPEPGAWPRFARVTAWKTNVAVGVRTEDVGRLLPGAAAVAHLTGTRAWGPAPAEL
ncbi:MAG: hypothetical protein JWO31_3075, partial [Phycisphaerales bacterium]|nr:hypothetical protein [Phycisphaerales bacterium]